MKNIGILIITILLTKMSLAQTNAITDEVFILKRKVLYDITFLDGRKMVSYFWIIPPKKIKLMDLVKRDQIKTDYSGTDADEVMKMTVDPTGLIDQNSFFDKYHIDKRYRDFKMLENNAERYHPETLLADPEYILKVVVNTNKRFINIITANYDNIINSRKAAIIENQKMRDEYKRRHPN